MSGLKEVNEEDGRVGLKISVEKTKVVRIKARNRDRIKVDGQDFEDVETFVYLVAMFSLQGGRSYEGPEKQEPLERTGMKPLSEEVSEVEKMEADVIVGQDHNNENDLGTRGKKKRWKTSDHLEIRRTGDNQRNRLEIRRAGNPGTRCGLERLTEKGGAAL